MATPTVLSQRVLNRTLLARQLLLEPSELDALGAVEHLAGLQAQVPASPYLGLRARLRGFAAEDLSTLLEARRVVRMALMRSTIHLVSTDDAVLMRPVIQPVLDRELFMNRTWATGLEGVDLAPVLDLGRTLVEARPRTLAELRDAMAARFSVGDPGSLAYAIRNLLPTLQATPRGLWARTGEPRLTTLEAWAGRSPAMATDPAPLLRRYLAAFGPATVADMQAWSRLTGLRAVVEGMRPTLRAYRDERGRALFDLPDAPVADPGLPAPVRFLPDYDNALLGHADRGRIIPPLDWPVGAGPIGRPTFLVDGMVAGTWAVTKPASRGEAARLVVRPLVPLRPADEAEVFAEAHAVAAFLASATPGTPAPVVERAWS